MGYVSIVEKKSFSVPRDIKIAGQSSTLNKKTPIVWFSFVIQPFVGDFNYWKAVCSCSKKNTTLDAEESKTTSKNQPKLGKKNT